MSHLWLYVPVMAATLVVLEICREDNPRVVLRKAGRQFAIWTLVLVGGSAAVYALQALV